jgi:hypothetical protein
LRSEVADTKWSGQRSRMKQNAAGSGEVHTCNTFDFISSVSIAIILLIFVEIHFHLPLERALVRLRSHGFAV